MDKYMEAKKYQLGEDAGTAAHKLKKALLYHYVKLAGHHFCYQCGIEINNIEEFSVEHKIPWLDSTNPNELFYNLDNIAFSHLSCNVRAARRRPQTHGKKSTYNRGCRCELCTEANRKKIESQRKNRHKDL